MNALYGGIEAGGTTFLCAVGSGPNDVRATARVPAAGPDETLYGVIEFFRAQQRHEPLAGIGIGAFGPLDLDPRSPTFGFITTTPKPGWAKTDLVGTIRRALAVRVCFDTDVNAAAFGEQRWGAAQGLDDFVYLTAGTGIGGGGFVNGGLMHGLSHPEMGHIRIPHDHTNDPYPGHCPYHGDCLEGLASGPALEQRWGRLAEMLPADHPAWDIEAHYLGLGIANIICTLSPRHVVLGGGLMQQAHLLPMVRKKTREILSGYIDVPEIIGRMDDYIVAPKLGQLAGVLGALALAMH